MIKLNPISTPLQFELPEHAAQWRKTFASHGGLDVETGAFIPLKKVKQMLKEDDGLTVNYVMDAIAGAVEYGTVQLSEYADFKAQFARPKDIPDFLLALSEYGESFWLNERHFRAFFNELICDDMKCNTYQAIAAWLEDYAE